MNVVNVHEIFVENRPWYKEQLIGFGGDVHSTTLHIMPVILVMSQISALCTSLTLCTKHIPWQRFELL